MGLSYGLCKDFDHMLDVAKKQDDKALADALYAFAGALDASPDVVRDRLVDHIVNRANALCDRR